MSQNLSNPCDNHKTYNFSCSLYGKFMEMLMVLLMVTYLLCKPILLAMIACNYIDYFISHNHSNNAVRFVYD